jgi:AraC family transcriptional regulator of adaptative response / DNA-3-methyladenine glycosylase II
VIGSTYRRTIMVDGAPGLLEVSPGDTTSDGGEHLLLWAHLPYWEGLIHVVGRAGLLLGTEGEFPGRGDRPAPAAWNPFEARIRAALKGLPAPRQQDLVTRVGLPVPGLPGGLTHALPNRPEPIPDDDLRPEDVMPEGRVSRPISPPRRCVTMSS